MRKLIITGAVALVAGVAVGKFLLPGDMPQVASGEAQTGEKEILYWVAPMDPNFRRDKPGKSPMGMDLIPVYAGDEAGADENALQISGAVVNNIGVRTASVTTSDLARTIDTVGTVVVDETRTAHVHVRTAGWIEKLNKKAVGDPVKKGEVVFELYSPDLVAAQQEYLQALRLQNRSLMMAGAERLRTLGMIEAEIEALRTSGKLRERIEVLAPQDGVIIELTVGEGMHVTPGRTVLSLADLSAVWLKADVFEAQAGWLETGAKAHISLPSAPGEMLMGQVEYIYPTMDTKTRTVPVRISLENAEGQLKPGMFAEVSFEAAPLEDVLSVPREALIRSGKTDRVVLALGDGKFRPAEVIAGPEVGNRVVIRRGLADGETVVTSGQFLIDSEASLNGAFLRMLDAGHADMEMADEEDSEEADEPEIHHGMGTVVSVNEDGSVTMTHDPIESLGWPEMTMDFRAEDGVDLSVFEEGDRMHFMIRRSDEGPFIITMAMKM